MASRQYWVIGLPPADSSLDRERPQGSAVLGPFQSHEQAAAAAALAQRDKPPATAARYSIIASAHNPVRRHLLAAVDSLQALRSSGA